MNNSKNEIIQIKEQESKVKNLPVSNATDLAKLWCMCESAFGRAVLEVIEYLRSLVVSSADGHAKRPRTHRHQPVTAGHQTRSYYESEEGARDGRRRGWGVEASDSPWAGWWIARRCCVRPPAGPTTHSGTAHARARHDAHDAPARTRSAPERRRASASLHIEIEMKNNRPLHYCVTDKERPHQRNVPRNEAQNNRSLNELREARSTLTAMISAVV